MNAGRHTRGASEDVTLINLQGKPLRMATDHNGLSMSAHVDTEGVLADPAVNVKTRRNGMERKGSRSIATE